MIRLLSRRSRSKVRENQHADLHSRMELKYFISFDEFHRLRKRLSLVLRKDEHVRSEEGYFIRSLYFDSKSDTGYASKIDGLEKRVKYRLRLYDFDSPSVKFEMKEKFNNVVIKQSANIRTSHAHDLMDGKYECLLGYKNRFLNRVYYQFKREFFRPVVMIDYLRTAFCMDLNRIRITFDKYVRKNEVDHDLFSKDVAMFPVFPVLEDQKLIMEIKYNNFLPGWIRDVLGGGAFIQSAISKYCVSRMI